MAEYGIKMTLLVIGSRYYSGNYALVVLG